MWGRRLAALIIALVVAPLTSLLLSLFTGGWGALIMLFFLFSFVPAALAATLLVALPGLAVLDLLRLRGVISCAVLGTLVGLATAYLIPWFQSRSMWHMFEPGWVYGGSLALALFGTWVYGSFYRWFEERSR